MGEADRVADQPSPRATLSAHDHHVLTALGDPVSLEILAALSLGDRDGHRLVVDTDLPQSSVYRKLRDLQASELVRVQRLAFTAEGRKVEVFASRVREVRVEFSAGRVVVRARSDASDRITNLWGQVRGR